MKKILLTLSALLSVSALSARAQTPTLAAEQTSAHTSESRTFFPKNWIRGYVDFDVAPSHNEPDLGRCAFPQPASAGGINSQCTAYGRYYLSGYLELQPFGRTFARHFFVFLEPKMTFGRNIPQLLYTASMEPISFDRSVGIAFQLPKNFQIRATQHQVDFLGRYSRGFGHQRSLRSQCHIWRSLVFRRLWPPGRFFGLVTQIP